MTQPNSLFTPAGGPPNVSPPSPQIYKSMGKEGIFAMMADFYRLLAKSKIHTMFPADPEELMAASQKSAAFFVQICGGPPLYQEQYGPPRLRARHIPFPIDEAAKSVWLHCFQEILNDAPVRYQFPAEHMDGFVKWLTALAAWMVNKQQ